MLVTGIIFSTIDTDAEAVESWNRWYDLEHLPPNIAMAGVVGGKRYVAPPALHTARLPERPVDGFEDGKSVHATTYLLGDEPGAVIAAMTEERERLIALGRMEGAGNRVVRSGDAAVLQWAVGDPALKMEEQEVVHVGHNGLRVVWRRGGSDPEAVGRAAADVVGCHGVASFAAQFQDGIDIDLYYLEGDAVEVTERLRAAAPYTESEILVDAPFEAIVAFDYSFAEAIRNSDLPQTIDTDQVL
jgi:hypothetical protein